VPAEISRVERSIISSDRPFATKVRELHEHWEENREVGPLIRQRDRASQLAMLMIVHQWCTTAAAEIRAVYGESFVQLSEPLDHEGEHPRFSLKLGTQHQLSAELLCDDPASERWHVQVRLRLPHEPSWVVARWSQRTSNWTREQLEKLLLSLLSSGERVETAGVRTTPH
jgi:hypothetical protein